MRDDDDRMDTEKKNPLWFCHCCGRRLKRDDFAYRVNLFRFKNIATEKELKSIIPAADAVICGECMKPVARKWHKGWRKKELMGPGRYF